ncbi:MAG: Crp/Fnr family transcriptional regulator [Cyanobacteria bacterium J007]|nr:MAG: Crp/Fnr family transcriptional regulator [Cyanobacteria bacterium J007]
MLVTRSICPSYRNHLAVVHNPQLFKPKASIVPTSDTIWKIERGVLRTTTWNEEGKRISLGFWGSGDVVGQPLTRLTPCEMECLTPTELSPISTETSYFAQALLVRGWKNEELLSIIHQTFVSDRLILLLQWLSRQFGKEIERGILLDMHLTHEAIAETIGTTRVTVTRLLKTLEREGRIHKLRRQFVVSDRR